MSNVGSEQTFENLVDKILDQLKSMTFEIWMPWFSVLSFFIEFISY